MRMFRLLRTIRTALKGLRRNPMRAALTALGIIIGVASVIIMMEIGKGSSAAIQRTIASMGANNLLIQPGTAASGGVSFGSGTDMTLTPDDAEAVSRECPAVRAVAPMVRARTQVIYGNRNWVPFFIFGTTPEYLDVREWTAMAAGRDVHRRAISATPARCACSGRRWSASCSAAPRPWARRCGFRMCRSR